MKQRRALGRAGAGSCMGIVAVCFLQHHDVATSEQVVEARETHSGYARDKVDGGDRARQPHAGREVRLGDHVQANVGIHVAHIDLRGRVMVRFA